MFWLILQPKDQPKAKMRRPGTRTHAAGGLFCSACYLQVGNRPAVSAPRRKPIAETRIFLMIRRESGDSRGVPECRPRYTTGSMTANRHDRKISSASIAGPLPSTAPARFGTSARWKPRPWRMRWSSPAPCASRATEKPGIWRNGSSRRAVLLSKIQIDLLRPLASHHDPESYVAGASALNRDGARRRKEDRRIRLSRHRQ